MNALFTGVAHTRAVKFLRLGVLIGCTVCGMESPAYATQPIDVNRSILTEVKDTPGGLPRYAVDYGYLDDEKLAFYKAAKITILHWHGPFAGYDGLPDRFQLQNEMRDARRAVQKAHALGIKILFYISPTIVYGQADKRTLLFDFYDKRWEQYSDYLGTKPAEPLAWVQRDARGNPVPYAVEKTKPSYCLCPNSPGTRRYIQGLLRFAIDGGADGVFFDGPMFSGGMCSCDHCKAKFKARHPELHPPIRPGDARTCKGSDQTCVAWQAFFADSLAEFLGDMRAFARAHNPHFMITSNYWTREPSASLRQQAADAGKWSPMLDILFCESDYETGPVMVDGKKYSNSYLYKYLFAAAHGKPAVMLKTAVQSDMPQAQSSLTKLCMAEASANHVAWAFWKLNNSAKPAAIEYNVFLADHADLFTGWTPYAGVAVLSDPGQVHYGRVCYDAAASRLLTDNHIPHSIVTLEDADSANLGAFKLVIVPNIEVISDVALGRLCGYVEKGGNVFLLGKSAALNPSLKPRDLKNYLRKRPHPANWTGAGSASLGKGKMILLPAADLPLLVRPPLDSKAMQTLQPVIDSLDTLVPQARLLETGADSSVEITAHAKHSDNSDLIKIGMVNYAVTSAGVVREKDNITVSIRLPEGFSCQDIAVLSPDFGKQKDRVPFKTTTKSGINTIKFSVARLKIFTLLTLNLTKDAATSELDPPRNIRLGAIS